MPLVRAKLLLRSTAYIIQTSVPSAVPRLGVLRNLYRLLAPPSAHTIYRHRTRAGVINYWRQGADVLRVSLPTTPSERARKNGPLQPDGIQEAPHVPRVGAGADPPPNLPPRPASGSHRLLHTLGQDGEQYGPSIAPFARAIGAHFHHFKGHIPQAGQRAGRTRNNFRVSDLAVVCCFIAFVLDIPNGCWPLNRAVGGLYT
jgi:hypothetical protein